ncbi:acyltransferase family protein [Peterkaempfera bronchialis]|uniref:Acyltransferase n=1 Tax=Peterkaempfera bronchialis TaxID=2126346 RepID=A0A345SW63_9ACTN|nr:acyltransferase [Peterkaempfera bronchialis]AXI77968.1 acyltransferase [Peterkaempfera bronchialis]
MPPTVTLERPSRRDPGPGADPDRQPAGARRGQSGRPRLQVLDGLRLLAALGVLSWHYTGIQQALAIWGGRTRDVVPAAHAVGQYGWLGVELFFLISGFVICMSCWGRPARDLFRSRVVRLLPAYWVAVLTTSVVLFLVRPPWVDQRELTFSRVLSNLTMGQAGLAVDDIDPVYWTLWVELRFYVLFAIVAALGVTYRRVVLFCGIWMFAVLLTPRSGLPLLDLVVMPQYAPFFIAGVAMYLMYRVGPNPLLWGIVGFSWLVAQHEMHTLVRPYISGSGHPLSFPVVLTVVTVAFLAVLGTALGAFRRLRYPWLTTAGALTYPLYLLHQEIGWIVLMKLHGLVNPYLLLAGLTAALLALAWLVHRWVERPAARLLRRWLDSSFHALRRADSFERAERAEQAERAAPGGAA